MGPSTSHSPILLGSMSSLSMWPPSEDSPSSMWVCPSRQWICSKFPVI
ncbi:hypothetical protein cypCar_00014603 [Cyprinus carpio]|nr:hypothetical protein cypCar_00014603 [Cyprinus carpio]